MGSTTDKIKGLANEAVGNVKQALGKATDDRQLEAEGVLQARKGEIQQASAKVQEALKKAVDRL